MVHGFETCKAMNVTWTDLGTGNFFIIIIILYWFQCVWIILKNDYKSTIKYAFSFMQDDITQYSLFGIL